MVGLGLIHLVVGLFAVISGQPYCIWYPLVLLGIITTAVFGGLLPLVRKRYQEPGQRGMQASTVGRG